MQRYKVRCHDCDPEITPHENGKWVRWGDVERLRSELTEARKPDCRSCRYYFEIEEDCFLLRKNERCINASEYEVQGAPVRLYERGE